jgi:cytochrome c556
MANSNGILGTLTTAGVVLCAGAVLAAGLTGAEAQKYREDHMKQMGKAMKAMADQLKTGSADAAAIKPNADVIVAGAKALPTWFPKGSGVEAAPKSRALAVVWTEPQDFAAKAHAFALAAAKLDAVSGSGDMATVVPALKAVGGACHDCHEKFQAKEKD